MMGSLQAIIKARRVELALSQNEVNKRCEFHPARYATIERGKDPTEAELKIIQSVLQIDLSDDQPDTGEEQVYVDP